MGFMVGMECWRHEKSKEYFATIIFYGSIRISIIPVIHGFCDAAMLHFMHHFCASTECCRFNLSWFKGKIMIYLVALAFFVLVFKVLNFAYISAAIYLSWYILHNVDSHFGFMFMNIAEPNLTLVMAITALIIILKKVFKS